MAEQIKAWRSSKGSIHESEQDALMQDAVHALQAIGEGEVFKNQTAWTIAHNADEVFCAIAPIIEAKRREEAAQVQPDLRYENLAQPPMTETTHG